MILVLGGYASGKRTYVRETYGYADCNLADGMIDDRPVVFNAQDLVAQKPADMDSLVSALAKKKVVVCNEVGSGIIPMTKRERDMREAAGRLCILLAKEAELVIRIVCGLPTVLKR